LAGLTDRRIREYRCATHCSAIRKPRKLQFSVGRSRQTSSAALLTETSFDTFGSGSVA